MIEKLIILKACREFSVLGIKKVNMDMIASSLHISKRTIYQIFENKQKLLVCCLEYRIKNNLKILIERIGCLTDIVDIVIEINRLTMRFALSFSPVFYIDLECNPDLDKLIGEQYVNKINDLYKYYFEKGIREQIFLPDFDECQVLSFFDQQIVCLCKKTDLQQIESYAVTILIYLSGICTDKGRKSIALISTETFLVSNLNKKQV